MTRAKMEVPIRSRALVLGLLVAALMALGLMLEAKPAHADTTFTVTRTDDSGDPDLGDDECGSFAGRGGRACSLRAAIQQANATPGADTINFNIPEDPNVPGDEVKTISPTSVLDIRGPVIIDGYTQPGARPNSQEIGTNAILRIELNGEQIQQGVQVPAFRINASNVVVRGLAINRFPAAGIESNLSSNDITGTRIEGNFIGTDPGGTLDRGNAFSGVSLRSGSKNAVVGGATPDKRNLISGNGAGGVSLGDRGSNKVMGNLIGTSKDGTSPLGNDLTGIAIGDSSNNIIGGTDTGAANTIAFNGKQGVLISGDEGVGNRILGNSVFSNGLLGIDLGSAFRTDNDPRDPDKGANTLQNFPVLTDASSVGDGKITIKGTLDSTPSTKKKKKTFTIQFFSSPQNEDEGKTFLGQKKVTTNRQGQASFSFETTKPVPDRDEITATATGPGGNTSEFSDPEILIID